jgi:mannose-6-phosphate isomerase-like protein (cupin superfamily)
VRSLVFRRTKAAAKRRRSEGVVSRALLENGDLPEASPDVSWVEAGPGSFEYVRPGERTRSYVVIRGRAWTKVGDEGAEATEGDLFYVPAGLPHAIANASDSETLVYLEVRDGGG